MEVVKDKTSGRIESLQILRAFAFLGIFASHCGIASPGIGSWGSSVFFALSGFLMVYRYLGKDVDCTFKSCLLFSINKVSKLYYLHIITMIASLMFPVFFHGSSILEQIAKNYRAIILHISLLQSWIPQSNYYFSLNGPSWFLSDCLFIYAVFPLILFLIKKLKTKQQAGICLIIIYILHLVFGYGLRSIHLLDGFSDNFVKWAIYINPIYRLGDFIIGGLLGCIYEFECRRCNKDCPSMIQYTILELFSLFLFIISRMIVTGIITGFFRTWWFMYSGLYIPSNLLFIWVFAFKRGVITRTIQYKFLHFIGNVSMYAYLIHGIVIGYLQKIWFLVFQNNITRFYLIVLSLSVTCILSVLFEKHNKDVLNRIKI